VYFLIDEDLWMLLQNVLGFTFHDTISNYVISLLSACVLFKSASFVF